MNFFGVKANLAKVKKSKGNPAGARWALYTELKAQVEALGLRTEHCSMAVINEFDRCTVICHHNKRHNYDFDCTGKIRVSDQARAELAAKERNLH